MHSQHRQTHHYTNEGTGSSGTHRVPHPACRSAAAAGQAHSCHLCQQHACLTHDSNKCIVSSSPRPTAVPTSSLPSGRSGGSAAGLPTLPFTVPRASAITWMPPSGPSALNVTCGAELVRQMCEHSLNIALAALLTDSQHPKQRASSASKQQCSKPVHVTTSSTPASARPRPGTRP